MTLEIKRWILCAIALIVLALGALLAAQTLHLSHAQTALATAQADIAHERQQAAEAARAQSEKYRELESKQHDEIARIDQQTSANLASAHAEADRARAAAGSLRQQLDAYVTAARRTAAANGTVTRIGPSDPDALDVLADLFSRADSRAGELAAIADDARIRGAACERAYDSARAMSEAAVSVTGETGTVGVSGSARATPAPTQPAAQQ